LGCSEAAGYVDGELEAALGDDGNKKFIMGIDGRKVPTRSASAIVNSLFQSAGVICAKKAMVLHDRMLKAENLAVDFWTQDWKNSSFVQAAHRIPRRGAA
jgi:hypothetical protein